MILASNTLSSVFTIDCGRPDQTPEPIQQLLKVDTADIKMKHDSGTEALVFPLQLY